MAKYTPVIEDTKGKAIVTPKGSALWVRIKEPLTEYDPDGQYLAKVVLDPTTDDFKKFEDSLQKMLDSAVAEAKDKLSPAKAKTLVVKPVVADEEGSDGELTGNVVVNSKVKAIWKNSDGSVDNIKVPVHDVKGVEMKDFDKLIGNGSTIRLRVWAKPYYMAAFNQVGISYRLNKVQLIDLVEYASKGDDFNDETGGALQDDSGSFEDTDGDF